MLITLGSVMERRDRARSTAAETLAREYQARAARLCPMELAVFSSEQALLAAAARTSGQAGRPAAHLALFDPRGCAWSSDQFARRLERLRDDGTQRLLFGIGPPDGWSENALTAAHERLSLGPMTLPHELARVVAAEQIYRALTILAGHPYHCGH